MTNPSTPSGAASSSQNPPAGKVSLWEDFIDILHSPSQVFARRENAGFWLPMIIVTVVVGGLLVANSGLLQPIFDAEFQRGAAAAMRKNPQLTEEQMASMRHVQEIGLKFFAFIFVPIIIFFTGIVLWLVGKLFDATESLKTAIVVASYAFVPRIVEGILATIQGLLLDPSSMTSHYAISLGVGRFLNPDTTSPVLLALVGRVDVFTIWVTVLLAIGLSVTGKIPRSRAAAAAACVWVVGALPALIPALRS
jgi:hypothetical protein